MGSPILTIASPAQLAVDGVTLNDTLSGGAGGYGPASGLTGFVVHARNQVIPQISAGVSPAGGLTVILATPLPANLTVTVDLLVGSGVTDSGSNTAAGQLGLPVLNRSTIGLGYYTSQLAAENIFDAVNISKWSNKSNTTIGFADPLAVQDALNRTDREFDRVISYYQYAVPIATTAADYGFISDLAAEYFGVLLYEARGLHDTAEKKASAWAGKMEGHRQRVMGDPDYQPGSMGRNLGELRRLCINGLRGVSRGVSQAPFVLTNLPYGAVPPAGKANWPATAPDVLT